MPEAKINIQIVQANRKAEAKSIITGCVQTSSLTRVIGLFFIKISK
ncbi:hypothetical protein [Peribacillus simplex]|nr:hypothetical protein [Peribacillus simplex]